MVVEPAVFQLLKAFQTVLTWSRMPSSYTHTQATSVVNASEHRRPLTKVLERDCQAKVVLTKSFSSTVFASGEPGETCETLCSLTELPLENSLGIAVGDVRLSGGREVS